MVDELDPPRIFLNALEARAADIVTKLNEPELTLNPVRFPYRRSFDYSVSGQVTFTAQEIKDGRPLVMVIDLAKSDETTVAREFDKAVSSFDRSR